MELLWYALEIKSKLATTILASLEQKGYKCLHPTCTITRRWCDRMAKSEVPLFPGYLFANFDANDRLPVLVTPGVKRVVAFSKIPAPIPDDEIVSIETALKAGLNIYQHTFPAVGQLVEIESGALAGVKGTLVNVKKGWRVVISVPLIQQCVSVEIDCDRVRPIASSDTARPSAVSARRRSVDRAPGIAS